MICVPSGCVKAVGFGDAGTANNPNCIAQTKALSKKPLFILSNNYFLCFSSAPAHKVDACRQCLRALAHVCACKAVNGCYSAFFGFVGREKCLALRAAHELERDESVGLGDVGDGVVREERACGDVGCAGEGVAFIALDASARVVRVGAVRGDVDIPRSSAGVVRRIA